MPALSDNELVYTLKNRLATVVRLRMEPRYGNNVSVLTRKPVPVALMSGEIGQRDTNDLQQLLNKVANDHTTVIASGLAFTVTSVRPGDAFSGLVFMRLRAESATKTR